MTESATGGRLVHYCTYFDRNYLTRGLALYGSLRRHSGPFVLWVLCFDEDTHRTLSSLRLADVRLIRLADFEAADPELVAVKSARSTVEYYFTSTPSLPLYVLRLEPRVETITYLDADLLFYSSPAPVIERLEHASVAIVPHGFPEHLRHLDVHGIYNVGLVAFRNDERGRTCLERWRAQCLEWCYDRVEDGRFADQRYLDDWPRVLEGVGVVEDPGVGLAPWNFMRHRIDFGVSPPTVDGEPLVFYHFHAFKSIGPCLYDLGLAGYGSMPWSLRRQIYGGYIDALNKAAATMDRRSVRAPTGAQTARSGRPPTRTVVKMAVKGNLMLALGPVRF